MFRPFLAGAALVLVGCSTGEVSLGVQITPPVASASSPLITAGPSTTPTTPPGTSPVPIGLVPSTSSLELTRVRLLLNEAELHGGDSSGHCPNMGPSTETDGPAVIDLSADNLQNGVRKEISLGKVAAGTYSSGELEIEPLEKDDADSTAPGLADFKTDGASLIVNGTYNGKDFEFRGHFKADQTSKGPIDIGGSSSVSLTLAVDPSTWFKDAQGNLLDPTDASLHDQIAHDICTTLDLEPLQEPQHAGPDGRMGRHHGGHPEARCTERVTTR